MAATERHLLHFRADASTQSDSSLTFYAGFTGHSLHAHNAATRADARVGNALLQQLPDAEFSHYLEVDLPCDGPLMTWLARSTEVEGVATENLVCLNVHVPRANREIRTLRGGSWRAGEEDAHPKLAWLLEHLGLNAGAADMLSLTLDPSLLHDVLTPFDTAASLLYQHPELINLSNTCVS